MAQLHICNGMVIYVHNNNLGEASGPTGNNQGEIRASPAPGVSQIHKTTSSGLEKTGNNQGEIRAKPAPRSFPNPRDDFQWSREKWKEAERWGSQQVLREYVPDSSWSPLSLLLFLPPSLPPSLPSFPPLFITFFYPNQTSVGESMV